MQIQKKPSSSMPITFHMDDGVVISATILNPASPGVPLVMVSGLSSLPIDFGSFPQDLARSNRPVVTFANRGLGESKLADGGDIQSLITLDRMAMDTHSVAKQALAIIDVERRKNGDGKDANSCFDLLGHSMGGFISLTLTSRTPRSPLMKEIGFKNGETREQMTERLIALNLDENFKMDFPETFKEICRNSLTGKRPVTVILSQAKATVDYDLTARLRELSHIPVLIIHGVLDKVIPVAEGDLIANGIPSALYLRMAHVGHLPMFYAGEAFANIVDGFTLSGKRGNGDVVVRKSLAML
ncbi:hypothetical protein HDU67_007199 [Dinochytrium kinnereticum]|nr:hypothetical protein HDU67_007199 [Dinochytrium kinnereticum]